MANGKLEVLKVQQFDTQVKKAFSDIINKLDMYTRKITGFKGESHRFNKMGKALAKERTARFSNVEHMGLDYGTVQCYTKDYTASEYTDIFLEKELNYSSMNDVSTVIAKALQRRADQIVIDTLASGTFAEKPDYKTQGGLVPATSGGSSGNQPLNLEKLLQAKLLLDDNYVDSEKRYFLISAQGLKDLLKTTEVTNSDYASVKALVSGDVDTFLGFKFIMVGSIDEGGLPKSSQGIRDAFVWVPQSVGYIEGIMPSIEVNYIPEKLAHLTTGKLKAGSCIIDNGGIVKVQYVEA